MADKATTKQVSVSDDLHAKNSALNPAVPTADKDSQNDTVAETVQSHKDEVKEVDTKLGTSSEEKAAKRADVTEERLSNPRQNREPKNEFEKDNQKVTDAERKAAQKASDMTTKKRVEKSEAPAELAKNDATKTAEVNQSSDIASAIAEGFSQSKKDSFKLEADPGIEHRFSLVKNKEGDVMLRENETGTLSKLQLESLEEKEASIQNQDVEEL